MTNWTTADIPDQTGRVAVITGANTGLGFETAKALAAKGLPLEPGDPVKRMPKGFEAHAGSSLEPALKRTRWLVRRSLTGAEIGDGELPEVLADFAAQARPLLDFGWKALGDARE